MIVAALLVPIIIGFYSEVVGSASLLAHSVSPYVLIAAGQRPRGPDCPGPAADEHSHVLLVVTYPVEEPPDVAQILRAAGLLDESDSTVVLVLAPRGSAFLTAGRPM